jgi:hypothetical protein
MKLLLIETLGIFGFGVAHGLVRRQKDGIGFETYKESPTTIIPTKFTERLSPSSKDMFPSRTHSAAQTECRASHGPLLATVRTELSHLEKHAINASSLDSLYWPRYRKRQSDALSGTAPYFQIYQGKLYAHKDAFLGKVSPDSQLFRAFTLSFCSLLREYPDLPPMRLMVFDEDGTDKVSELPVFVPWKIRGSVPISYPASFLEVQPVDGSAWSKKLNKAFFIGSEDNDAREQLFRFYDLDQESRQLMDIHDLTRLKAEDSKLPHHFYTYDEQAHWKYLLILDGEAARATFSTSLSTGSLNLKQISPYYEYFEPALTAYKHFVPVNLTDSDASRWDLKSQILWAREHDATARQIAENARRFAQDLQGEGAECYFLELLLQYHDLMGFDDSLPSEFADSPDICQDIDRHPVSM